MSKILIIAEHDGDYGRFKEAAAERVALAAGNQATPLVQGVGDVFLHFFDCGQINQGALLHAVFGPRADLQSRYRRGEFVDECIVDVRLRVNPIRTNACLAGVPIFRHHRAFNRRIEVGVVEDDERRVAAELHGHFLYRRSSFDE